MGQSKIFQKFFIPFFILMINLLTSRAMFSIHRTSDTTVSLFNSSLHHITVFTFFRFFVFFFTLIHFFFIDSNNNRYWSLSRSFNFQEWITMFFCSFTFFRIVKIFYDSRFISNSDNLLITSITINMRVNNFFWFFFRWLVSWFYLLGNLFT